VKGAEKKRKKPQVNRGKGKVFPGKGGRSRGSKGRLSGRADKLSGSSMGDKFSFKRRKRGALKKVGLPGGV